MNSHETIDKFLNGQLTPEETAHFLETVEHDSELQSLLESERIINSCLNKEKLHLMQHDLSAVAGAFVAGLASTGTVASSGLITAAYAKKAGMSWLTLAASSALSISVCAGAYWYLNSQNDSKPIQRQSKIDIAVQTTAKDIPLKVPRLIVDKQNAPMKVKSRSTSVELKVSNKSEVTEPAAAPVKKQILEHSFSKYRPKIQD